MSPSNCFVCVHGSESPPAHPFPNDNKSANNEAIAHTMFLKLFNDRPYTAPIEEPRNIIDLGTGTGLWASLVADWFDGENHPLAAVKGVDLAPQQDSSLQPNLEFEVDDITKDWASHTLYDLVHIRLLWGVIDDWRKVYAECFKYVSLVASWFIAQDRCRHMNSGGYLQFADVDFTPRCDDGTMAEDNVWREWQQTAHSFAEISQRRFFSAEETEQEMKDAGFVDIVQKKYKLPIGGWSSDPRYREIGRVSRSCSITPGHDLIVPGVVVWKVLGDRNGRLDLGCCDGSSWGEIPLRSTCDAAFRVTDKFQWSLEKVNKMLQKTRDTLADRRQHSYHYAYVDDRISLTHERGSPALQGGHIRQKAIVPCGLDRKSSGSFYTTITS